MRVVSPAHFPAKGAVILVNFRRDLLGSGAVNAPGPGANAVTGMREGEVPPEPGPADFAMVR
jgi:hypothetical protein